MIPNILLFADRLPPAIGGMEMHGYYFIEHFTDHPRFPLAGIVTRTVGDIDCLMQGDRRMQIDLDQLPRLFTPAIVFFNSGRWIESLPQLRQTFPQALFVYRTGGNEILKAPLEHQHLEDHRERQAYWVRTLNDTVDLMITNSEWTEKRLLSLEINCRIARCVGGVKSEALIRSFNPRSGPPVFFCAARFVPYKNHTTLISVASELARQGFDFELRLAGDGPLLGAVQEQVCRENLSDRTTFLGSLDNRTACHEMALADFYIQLSTDHETVVPGGSYIHSEGMGRSILEALTAGTFVIAGRSGALPEIVTPGRGVLLDLDTPKQIADRIAPLLAHPPARSDFVRDYDWAHIFGRYEQLWEDTDASAGRY